MISWVAGHPYWETFRQRIDSSVDAAFLVFTHFGCLHRQRGKDQAAAPVEAGGPAWCSYCWVEDTLSRRSGESIVSDALGLIKSQGVRRGSKVHLKCYGDNAAGNPGVLRALAASITTRDDWRDYDIGWTFYAKSSMVSSEVAGLFRAVGARYLFIGFDSVDDNILRCNGTGASALAHHRAAENCRDNGLGIQAAFVLGCVGETERSLQDTLRFAEWLASQGVLERVNAAVLFVVPGAPAYSLLRAEEPWLSALDDLPTRELQWHWVRHFCPGLGENPSRGLALLEKYANLLDELSPGPHASMGFESARLANERVRVPEGTQP